jgi:RES domain-containing protein
LSVLITGLHVTPLPALLGGGELVAWRLDRATYAASFDSGEGAYRAGGRWNSKGVRAVYCSIDPATAILEVAVHKGFKALDTVAHVLTAINITEPSSVRIVQPADVPNPNWLRPGIPSAGQQALGDNLLASHKFVVIPSTVSTFSWNVIFVGAMAARAYSVRMQEPFALDTRLHPAR